jgi:hypothetical protein
MKIQDVKNELTFDEVSGELIYKKDKKRKRVYKTYTEKEVKKLLREQKQLCSIIPLLSLSRMRTDWREWNKFMRSMNKAIQDLPLVKLKDKKKLNN